MYDEFLIGPYFLPERLMGESLLIFLTNDLPPLLEDVSLLLRQNGWIQLNGLHYARCVKNWFNRQYSQRWVGRGGPISWPLRSPDLTPLNFYLWSTLK